MEQLATFDEEEISTPILHEQIHALKRLMRQAGPAECNI